MSAPGSRDRDPAGRARNARDRDSLGRPLDSRQPGPVVDEPARSPGDALRRAQQLLDEGRPFEAHEVLEAVWKSTAGEERELWRGLAQLAVGITHSLRGNETGARTLLERAADTMAAFAGTSPSGIDVDGLRQWASNASEDLGLAADSPRLVTKPA
jgi:hypothetical protein